MNLPASFGKYVLLERINVGGMAEVFRAKTTDDAGFERLVAVKRILEDLGRDHQFIDMFIDEAKIAVQLNHANIAQIFDLGQVDGAYFIAMEYVHGKDLKAIAERCRAQSDPMPIRQACFVVMKICEGLDYAHSKRDASGRPLNLVHRDVSPPNVLLSYEGEVKLIDFGIVKAAGNVSKTQAGALKGKVGYMSPEQVRGLPVDSRSDVFSVGILLYELLTGQRLFDGVDDFSLLESVRRAEVPRPSTVNRKISHELEQIVLQALARDPDDRYQHAVELHDDLQAYLYASGAFYSRKDLAVWMKRVFAREMEEEQRKIKGYEQLDLAPASAPSPARRVSAGATGPRRPRPPTRPPGASGERPRGAPGVSDEAPAARSLLGVTHGATAIDALGPATDSAPGETGAPQKASGELGSASRTEGVASASRPSATAPSLPAVSKTAGGDAEQGRGAAKVEEPASATAQITWLPAWRRAVPLLVAGGVVALVIVATLLYVLLVRDRRPGALDLTVTPADVEVLLDGQRQGNRGYGSGARRKIEGLRAGTHALSVRRAEYVPWSGEIEIRSGEATQVSVQLSAAASGGVELRTVPAGATVRLDGVLLEGETPMRVSRLKPGMHRLSVSKAPEYGTLTREIKIAAGEVSQLSLALTSARVRLRVTSQPAGEVYLSEAGRSQRLGTTPVETLIQRGKTYSVEVRRGGYAPWSTPLVFDGARALTLEARLARQKPGATPTAKPAPSAKPVSKPGAATTAKPAAKPAAKPTPIAKPIAKPTPKPTAKPAAKPAAKPTPIAKPTAKPTPKPPAKPAAKPAAKPTPIAKPAAKPIPIAKPAAKPTPKPPAKPPAKPVAKPAAKPTPIAKPAAKRAAKPVAKPAAKPTPRPGSGARLGSAPGAASAASRGAASEGKPAKGVGRLLVNSIPWARIFVDGRDTGLTTPQRGLELPAGTHRIKLRGEKPGVEGTFTVEIRAGELTRLVQTLR